MIPRGLLMNLVLGSLFPAGLAGQQNPASTPPNGVQEFPVVLQQSITAGKTPVGTKVQAKLSIATLVKGTVVPRNAILSGEVVESTAKNHSGPSRIGIRMDSANWKNGSMPMKVYLTPWYYPSVAEGGQNLQYGPTQPPSTTWNGAGAYPDANSPAYKPFPGGEPAKGQAVPDTPNSITSQHRVLMKNVESEHRSDGVLVLVCKHVNIKLDRFTTYFISASNLNAK